MNDVSCAAVVELVSDYLEGALDAATRERVERHLAACTGCANYLDQMRQTIATAGRIEAERLPAPLREGLRGAFRGWRQQV